MLITQKLPQGHIYPQITQAPVTSYPDFLNYFRGGHTIDDNLGATSIQNTMQYNFFTTAITSGHLKKLKNMAIPNEFLADIFLTDTGSDLTQLVFDRKFCDLAVQEARKSIPEDDDEPHPFVGAVVVKDGKILATGYRGETGEGRHAEYCALRKINDDVENVDLNGCTVYTTLEPCSKRNSSNKTACATRLINAKVSHVVFGMPDKDESVYGHVSLIEANIDVHLFPRDLIQELVALNRKWSDTRRKPEVAPPSNDTSPLASVSYYKPGTSMADNMWLFVKPPKSDGGLFTIEDGAKTVLAWSKNFDEIAMKWHQIDDLKTIVEKLQRQSSGSSNRNLTLL